MTVAPSAHGEMRPDAPSSPAPLPTSGLGSVRIHYARPPDRTDVFDQIVLHRTETCAVTLLESATVERSIMIGGRPVLEPGAPVVWFTFAGEWHDIGRFHTADGTFTGLYANILTPILDLADAEWHTTDLFLDVWWDRQGASVIDVDELHDAVGNGWLDFELARRARDEAASLIMRAQRGEWPPGIVAEWTIEHAFEVRARRSTDPAIG